MNKPILPENISIKDIPSYFGEWFTKRSSQKEEHIFQQNIPYPHIVIDNFLNEELAKKCFDEFPEIKSKKWNIYNNPIEKKLACNRFEEISETIKNVILVLNTSEFIERIKEISGISNLEMDPYLHGGGIHSHPNGGKLDMHLDYSIHPISKKERRLNLILYLNKEWDKSYGGELQMWNNDMSECIQKVFPKFNRALLFQTSDLSYHGIPDKINCPNHLARNSIAIYYVSEPRENVILRKKAQFVKRPFEENSEGMEKLRKIRVDRLITNKDIQDAGFEIEEWPIIS